MRNSVLFLKNTSPREYHRYRELKGRCHEIFDFDTGQPICHRCRWLYLRITPRIFEKIRKPKCNFQTLGGRWFMKKTWNKKSCDTVLIKTDSSIGKHYDVSRFWSSNFVESTSELVLYSLQKKNSSRWRSGRITGYLAFQYCMRP